MDDREYPSLSRIAQAVTGTHWSGPRFFGITRKSGKRASAGALAPEVASSGVVAADRLADGIMDAAHG